MQKPKHTWDTRTLLVGILGGAIGGSLTIGAAYTPIHNWLNTFSVPLSPITAANIVRLFFLFFTPLVLPGLISGLARQWTFCWGLLPLSFFLVFFYLGSWIVKGFQSIVGTAWSDLGIMAICLLVSSGPVSLIRWLRVQAARRHTALMASHQAQSGAGSEPQEGVWPPPEYRE